MKNRKLLILLTAVIIALSFTFSGCEAIKKLTDKTPEKYTEGVKYDRDFPDDLFDIYDDAVVFESLSVFESIVIAFGTQDDLDDVADFYKEYFEDNEITPSKEKDDRDEYFAQFVFDGYLFKLSIQEPDGEYVEDVFSAVVYVSAEEYDGTDMKVAVSDPSDEKSASPDATPQPSDDATATPAPTAAPTPQNNGETPAHSIPAGSWELQAYYDYGTLEPVDFVLHINDPQSGSFYFYDYPNDNRGAFSFTYTLANGLMTLDTPNGTVEYNAYYDDGILHLQLADETSDMYLTNWNETSGIYPSDNNFTAYGDWMYYEPDTGYMETIAFWPDGSGYVYNWGGTYENYYMYWDYSDGVFTISDDQGDEYSYGIVHRGDVFELHQSNGSVFFYNRVSENNYLPGTFYLDETNDPDLTDWMFTLYWDGSMEHTINGSTAQSTWWIDNTTGKMHIMLGSDDFAFDYHYDLSGLYLWLPDSYVYYNFLSVG